MNTISEYEGRRVQRMIFPIGDWEKLIIDTQVYRDNQRYLSYSIEDLSKNKVRITKGLQDKTETINILWRDYVNLGRQLEEYIEFLQEDDKANNVEE